MNWNSEYSCLLLSVYFPCDNYINTASVENILIILSNCLILSIIAEILIFHSED